MRVHDREFYLLLLYVLTVLQGLRDNKQHDDLQEQLVSAIRDHRSEANLSILARRMTLA